MNKIIYILLLPVIFSCNNGVKKVSSDYLEFYYLRPGIRTPYGYSCGMMSKKFLGEDVNFKMINNKADFDKFISLYNNYEISKDSGSIDTRIRVFVHYKNKTDTLCLGENFSTYKNGVRMKDNIELLNLIKELTEFNSGLPDFVKKNPEKYGIKKSNNR